MFMPLSLRLRHVLFVAGRAPATAAKLARIGRYAERLTVWPEDPEVRIPLPEGAERLAGSAADADPESRLHPGISLVVSTADSDDLNRRLAEACRRLGIPVNVHDRRDLCEVYMMALAEGSVLTVAVTTGGRRALLAAEVRRELEPWVAQRDALVGMLTEIAEAGPGRIGADALRRAYRDETVRRRIAEGRRDEAAGRIREILGVAGPGKGG